MSRGGGGSRVAGGARRGTGVSGYKRPVLRAHRSTSRHSHAPMPLTTHRGSGSSPRYFHMAAVCGRTLSRAAISATPTGSGTTFVSEHGPRSVLVETPVADRFSADRAGLLGQLSGGRAVGVLARFGAGSELGSRLGKCSSGHWGLPSSAVDSISRLSIANHTPFLVEERSTP